MKHLSFSCWVWVDRCYEPLIVDDQGCLVHSNWVHFKQFFNQEYSSITAAYEVWR